MSLIIQNIIVYLCFSCKFRQEYDRNKLEERYTMIRAWWHMLMIPALSNFKSPQLSRKFETSLENTGSCLNKTKLNEEKEVEGRGWCEGKKWIPNELLYLIIYWLWWFSCFFGWAELFSNHRVTHLFILLALS